jgi:phosphatidylglycerophosphatase A
MIFKQKIERMRQERTKFIAALHPKSFDFQIATWFGSGLIIPAPGTWGTVGGMLFGIPLLLITNQLVVLIAAVVLFIVGLWSVSRLEKQLHDHDPSFIVIDEVVAILLGISALVGTTFQEIWLEAVLLFIFFRIFDAWKPWPISWADRKIHGALGVMLDDILAVIIAIITYKILLILVMLTIIPDYYGVDF